jgi:4-amino-4-deoxy-L-arabinose transferase-like glycosyltransferase
LFPFSARSLGLLAAAVLLSRLAVAVLLGVTGDPEFWEYDAIAASIARGDGHFFDRHGFLYAAYSPPAWSYLLAALLSLTGDARVIIQVAQALLCFAAAATFGAIAQALSGDRRTGLVAAALVAFQPSLLYYSVAKSDPLPVNVFLLGLILWAALGLMDEPRGDRALAFGVLVGLGVLSRGTPIVALPLMLAVLAARFRSRAAAPFAIVLLSLFVTLSPWLARNIAVIGAPLITSTAAENFWRGNHQGASGGVVDADGGNITRIEPSNPNLPPTIRAVLENGTEAQRHEAFMSEAWRFIRGEPLSALGLFGKKVRTFWWRIDSDPRDYSPSFSVTYELLYAIELALALMGVFALRRVPAAWLTLALMIGISLLQCAFYVQGRHRFFIEPILLIFTSAGLVTFLDRLHVMREPAAAAP